MSIRVCICGGREFKDYNTLVKFCDEVLANNWKNEITIISGGARGADSLGEKYAKEKGLCLEVHNADWRKYGKSAGIIRNKTMCDMSDLVIAFWDGKSRGTQNMIEISKRNGKIVFVCKYEGEDE